MQSKTDPTFFMFKKKRVSGAYGIARTSVPEKVKRNLLAKKVISAANCRGTSSHMWDGVPRQYKVF